MGNGPSFCFGPLPPIATHGTVSGIAQRTGRAMADEIPSPRRGRKPPPGDKRQFLTTINPEVIRAIKQAALDMDRTASDLMEEAAKLWLERHKHKK